MSYGVADADYARREGEFIYSLQRLNVSITRGQAKAIVFLPEPLLRPPVGAFAQDDLLAGVDFMLQLERFAVQRGEVHELTEAPGLPPSGSLRVVRVAVPPGA